MGVRVPLGTPLFKEENLKERIRQITESKQFHMCMVMSIIILIIFVVAVILLKYNVEGEGNPPFNLSKISIISNVEGTDTDDTQNKWNLEVNQNNDIYLYIKKNDDYKYTETISSVVLNNFKITQESKVGKIKLYKPDANVDSVIFKDSSENEVDSIEYKGDIDSSIKEMKISNQGGLVVFRYAIKEIGNYTSNDDEQINHNELLKKLAINNEDVKFKVSFDIIINLDSKKSYKAGMNLDLPTGNVVDNGMQSTESIDLKDIIFKRI